MPWRRRVSYYPESFDSDADTAECSWSATWLIGSGAIVDPGDQVEMIVTLTNLTPLLTEKQEFSIQVKPSKGAIVIVNRTLGLTWIENSC